MTKILRFNPETGSEVLLSILHKRMPHLMTVYLSQYKISIYFRRFNSLPLLKYSKCNRNAAADFKNGANYKGVKGFSDHVGRKWVQMLSVSLFI